MRRVLPWLMALTALVAVAWLAAPLLLESGEDRAGPEHALPPHGGNDASTATRLRGTGALPETSPVVRVGRARIRGTVVGPDGARVAGVGIEVHPLPSEDRARATLARRIHRIATGTPFVSAPLLEGHSDENGTFVIAVPRRRQYRLQARPDAGRCGASASIDLTWQDEGNVTLRLDDVSPLEGRVLGPTGEGIRALLSAACMPADGGTFEGKPIGTEEGTGVFRIQDLPAGMWHVTLRVPGRFELTGLAVEVPHEGVWTIQLGEGTGRVVGTVTDEDLRGIANAQVLVRTSVPGNRMAATALASTDAEGHYEMAAVPAGTVRRVEVLHEGGFLVPVTTPPLASWSGAIVKRGAETRLDVVLQRTAGIEGRVFDVQDDSPLEGARVMALAHPGPGSPSSMAAESTSGKDGRFRLEGVPRGRILLLATHATYYLAGLGRIQTRIPDRQASWNQTKAPPPALVVVIGRETRWVKRDLAFTRGARVTGIVLGPEGRPMEGVRVTAVGNTIRSDLSEMGFRLPDGPPNVTFTDDAGRFDFRNLPPSHDLRLVASKPTFPGVGSDLVRAAVNDPVPEVELRMPRGGIFVGRVVDDDDRGLANILVQAYQELPGNASLWTNVRTEVDGSFRLEGVPTGDGTLQALATPDAPFRRWAEVPFVNVEPDEVYEDIELRLPRTQDGRVSGVLVDRDGKPVVDQLLQLTGTGMWSPTTLSDGKGRFLFEHTPRGEVQLRASEQGVSPRPMARIGEPFQSPAENLRFVYERPPTRVIEGRVLAPDGEAVPFCRVSISTTEDRARWTQALDKNEVVEGAFRRVVHGDGPWVIDVTEPRDLGGTPLNLKSAKTRIESLPKNPVILRLETGDEVKGRVVDADGRGVPGVLVESGSVFAFTDSAGRFVLSGLDGEGATVSIPEVQGYVTPKGQVIRDLASEIVFRLERSARIAGRVVNPEGEALPDVQVVIEWMTPDGRTGMGSVLLASETRFEFKGLSLDAKANVTALANVISGLLTKSGNEMAPVTVKNVAAGTTDLVLTLGAGVVVSGTVATEDGENVTEGSVILLKVGAEEDPATNTTRADMVFAEIRADGSFFLQGIDPCRYTLLLHRQDGGPIPRPREITAPTADIKIIVPRGAAVTGRLIGKAPFDAYLITLEQDGARGWPCASTFADDDGSFLFEGVGAGTYTFRAQGNGERYGLLRGIRAGDEKLEIPLEHGLTIEGTLLDTRGERVADGDILASDGHWNVSGTVLDGHFELPGLPPGTYRLAAVVVPPGSQRGERTELGRHEAGTRGLTFRLK